jgi:hypothetical protein
VNGMRGPRRSVRPARIALANLLGCDVDGTWWSQTASVADEPPELVEALHRPTNPLWQYGLRQAPSRPGSRGRAERAVGRPAKGGVLDGDL